MVPTIATIPLLTLASGDIFSLQVYKFIGTGSGQKVYIQSNLHGAEIVGNAVIHELINFLLTVNSEALNGEIWLVPVCNPLSINQRSHHFSTGRFNLYDGKDWNRIFRDYEYECKGLEEFAKTHLNNSSEKIRQEYLQKIKANFTQLSTKINSYSSVQTVDKYRYKLQSFSIDANYLIDLHSYTGKGLDYLYCFKDREESAKLFNLSHSILFDKYDGNAFDEAFIKPWLALEGAFLKLGRKIRFDVEAWTLELGSGMYVEPNSVRKGVQGIKNYLLQKNVLSMEESSLEISQSNPISFHLFSQIRKYWAITGGIVQLSVALGDRLSKGNLLYSILKFNKSGQLPELINIFAESDGIVYIISTNSSVNEGEFILAAM